MATADGYEVAAVLKEEDPGRLHKIAAMTSSLLGVGAAMLNEIDAGGQKAITVEGERDNILLWQVATQRFPLCLTVVASAQEPSGNYSGFCASWRRPLLRFAMRSPICRRHRNIIMNDPLTMSFAVRLCSADMSCGFISVTPVLDNRAELIQQRLNWYHQWLHSLSCQLQKRGRFRKIFSRFCCSRRLN